MTSIFPNIPGTKVYQYVSYNVTIWTLSVMAAPVLIVAATFMKPYFLAYIFPVFSFITSFISYAKPIFSDDFEMRSTLYVLSFGISVLFMLLFWLVKRWIHSIYLADKIQEKTIDLLYEEVYKK
ncbi:hypothetical protein M2T79_15870 [Elizabethkingia miricola]|uniref:hypothetical protein n=1 Tax=Elizabethkingia miricola TaxID=172045 RepID=UPI00201855E8|nr:hypothetical protein [Elizabethkingia miricola]MCL1658081.1 hypothetical protein [Elizabethkingia miricola]